MAKSEKFTCAQIIEALTTARGMVYLAARELGCSHQTVYNYIRRHPSVRVAWEKETGLMGDRAELRLYQAILDDKPWAITFYLSTKAKDRGYTKRQEITGTEGGPLKITYVNDWRDDGDPPPETT